MTATIAQPAVLAGRVTGARVLRSEWTKFRSLASTWWSLGVAVILTVGLGLLVAAEGGGGSGDAAARASLSLVGVSFGQLVLGVLGVLVVSGEYGTGMIRSSLTVVPGRLPVLWAKLAVYAAVVFPASLVASLATVVGANMVWSGRAMPTAALSDPQVLRVVVGSALYLTVAGVSAIAVGTLLRHTAAGLAAVVGGYFVAPVVTAILPASLTGFGAYLPSNAGGALWGQTMTEHPLAPWTGFGVLCCYAAVLVGLAAWRLRRWDA